MIGRARAENNNCSSPQAPFRKTVRADDGGVAASAPVQSSVTGLILGAAKAAAWAAWTRASKAFRGSASSITCTTLRHRQSAHHHQRQQNHEEYKTFGVRVGESTPSEGRRALQLHAGLSVSSDRFSLRSLAIRRSCRRI